MDIIEKKYRPPSMKKSADANESGSTLLKKLLPVKHSNGLRGEELLIEFNLISEVRRRRRVWNGTKLRLLS